MDELLSLAVVFIFGFVLIVLFLLVLAIIFTLYY